MQATCWKSDEFRYILQPASCSYPIFQIKKHICTFYIDIHSLKYFQSIYHSCCKVRTQFVTCKLGDCRVWTLTNPINSKPKHNSGGGVGIRTDSYGTCQGQAQRTYWRACWGSQSDWRSSSTANCPVTSRLPLLFDAPQSPSSSLPSSSIRRLRTEPFSSCLTACALTFPIPLNPRCSRTIRVYHPVRLRIN